MKFAPIIIATWRTFCIYLLPEEILLCETRDIALRDCFWQKEETWDVCIYELPENSPTKHEDYE